MLTIDNKIYRNLQEQVEANKLSIQAILDEKGVLNQFGIRVIGKVDYVRELPEQDNPVHLEYGDAYAVGTETPYNLFIWTRQMSTTVGDFWFDIGKFPQPSTVPGPQGPQGQPGKDGENSKWYISLSVPSFTAVNNDMCLNVNNGDVYIYEDGWVNKGNIKGPQGIQGPKGDASTVPGPQGPQGPKGDRGSNTTWYLLGELTSTNQLPDPTTVRRDAAYLVDVGETNHLYVIVGTDTLTWVDAGVATQGIPGKSALMIGKALTLTAIPVVDNSITFTTDAGMFNRTPVVGDETFAIGTYNSINYALGLTCTSVTDRTVTFRINSVIEMLSGSNYVTLDMAFPVGKVIITMDDISPATYIPNTTWEKITDKFLVGAGNLYTAGSTGGSVTHKHSSGTLGAEVTISDKNIIINTVEQEDGYNYNPIAELTTTERQTYPYAQPYITPVIGNTGESNSLPPYLAVYIWKRIA